MESSIFKFIFRHSRKEQVQLLLLTVAGFPVLYFTLDLPKTIVNKAIGPAATGQFVPEELFGVELQAVPYLLVLCSAFLALVLVSGGFKYVTNVYRGVVGERMLRRLRYQLFNNVLRFPLPQFRKMSQGEIVAMVTAETEPLGGFVSDSIALPAFQGGTLITILIFMFVQDWKLGLAAVALYPLQAYIIPKLQRRVNELRKERIMRVRKLSERIGEVVGGIQEVHIHDTSQYELAHFSDRIGEIYYIRVKIYVQKFFIKFINNFINQVTPFFFYSIGGYLVISDQLTFGALVAILAAYKDLSDPWKELLNYYQAKEDARIKYDLLVETFEPKGLLDERLQSEDPGEAKSLLGDLVLSNVDLTDEDETEPAFPSTLSFSLKLPGTVAIAGDNGSGKHRLAMVLAGMKRPRSGRVQSNGLNLVDSPESVTGRRIAYVGANPSLRSGTLKDNLYYPLMHRPVRPAQYQADELHELEKRRRESRLAGNSELDVNADWIDYEAAGANGPEALSRRAIEVLRVADMEQDILEFGLQSTIDPQRQPALVERILAARAALRERLQDPEIAPLVEQFERTAYNANMSVAENIMFGTPRDESFDVDALADNPYMLRVLSEANLTDDFVHIGRQVAGLMVDLFVDVEPGSELFERFSFIDADDLPEFRGLLSRTEGTEPGRLDEADRQRLMALPFKLIPARHRLGLLDEPVRQRLLEAREIFARGFGGETPPVDFFDPERYSSAASIQDNILFGRLAYGRARAAARIGALIREVVAKLGLGPAVMEAGLDFPVGIGAARLTTAQRQKLSLARAVLKGPEILVLEEATAVLDAAAQTRVRASIFKEFRRRALIWIMQGVSLDDGFDQWLVMEDGKVVEQTSPVTE